MRDIWFILVYFFTHGLGAMATAIRTASVDHLTGLFSSWESCRLGKLEIARSERQKKIGKNGIYFSVIFIDLKDFGKINKMFGHLIGNQVLKEMAEVFKTLCRASDLLGRWGGDEFIIILPTTDLTQAEFFLLRLEENFSLLCKERVGRWNTRLARIHQFQFRARVATWRPGISWDQLLQEADPKG